MSLILSGTDGLSDIDGSAATPAIRGTDANTGIFFGADIIGFAEGGAEVARFNADAQFVAAAGTALLPVITTTGDVNTGIFFPAADTIAFSEGGVEAMRIDSSGNVGIETTTPNYKFNVGPTSGVTSLAGAGISLFTSGGLTSSIGGVLNFRPSIGTTASDIFNLSICAYDHSGDTNADGLSINASDGISFCTGSNSRQERARIDSSGYVGINMTPSGAGGQFQIRYDSSARACLRLETSNASTAGELINFIKSTGSATGAITFGASQNTIVYGGTSDYRLKDDIQPMTNALATVAQLKPVTYKWKSDGSNGQGFIAHELQSVLPDAVVGEKDAIETYIDEDNKEQTRPKYQQIDTSFLVATLTAAIKEQQTLIQSLTARITALETP